MLEQYHHWEEIQKYTYEQRFLIIVISCESVKNGKLLNYKKRVSHDMYIDKL